jgi:ATP-dependent DNA ligase
MKPKKWDGRFLGDSVAADQKFDGYRCTIEVNDTLKIYGRQEQIDLPETIRSKVKRFPKGSVVDGEVYVLGEPASSVVTYIKERSRKLIFQPFAVPFHKGNDLRFTSIDVRNEMLYKYNYEPVPMSWVKNPTIEKLQKIAADSQIEGFVLKQFHYAGWWKVKPVQTIDCIVTNYKAGEGKHRGRLGSLEVSLYDGTCIGWVGKGNDALWRDLDNPVGRVCEIQYEEPDYKFTSFVRWRPDKPREECV